MDRVLGRELLDEMDPSDPEAIASRRDLVRVNAWMRNHKAAARLLSPVLAPGKPVRLADIGAGDGRFVTQVLRLLAPLGIAGEVVLVDRQPVAKPALAKEIETMGWQVRIVEMDVFEWLNATPPDSFDAVIANLFLHHFDATSLSAMFNALVQRTRMVVAVEPVRSKLALALTRLLPVIGCNRITRHDAWLSVRSGFTGHELSDLWSESESWDLFESRNGMAGHVFRARRLTA